MVDRVLLARYTDHAPVVDAVADIVNYDVSFFVVWSNFKVINKIDDDFKAAVDRLERVFFILTQLKNQILADIHF